MKTTRKRYSPKVKAKVALEAIRGDLTLAELAAKHGIHHTMIAAEQPDGLSRNSMITRTIVREMRQCISVYCDVAKSGRVSLGDELIVSN